MRIVARILVVILAIGALAGFMLLSSPSSAPSASKNGKIVDISSGTGAIVTLGTGALVAVTE